MKLQICRGVPKIMTDKNPDLTKFSKRNKNFSYFTRKKLGLVWPGFYGPAISTL